MSRVAQIISAVLLAIAAACTTGLAFAAERVLLERKSEFNTITVTESDAGLRVLRFERYGARQSVVKPNDPDHLELAYARSFPIALALVETPRRILVVGLGGGTIPSFLRKRVPEAEIDVAEIDPEVVAVAKSHFGFREDAKLHAYVEDGRRFIERAREPYDLIVLDAFGTDSIPYALATREFLDRVKAALAPRGFVVGNVWGRSDNRLYDAMVRTYLSAFTGVAIVDVPGSGNKLVMACECKSMPTRQQVVERARAIGRKLELRHDLAELAGIGYREPGEDGATAQVLFDKK